jgi:large subunit ribosomal protein L9
VKVLLRSDIDGVGKRGDIVEVTKGFARNYLLPTGRALVAGTRIGRQADSMRRARDLRDAQDKEAAQTVAAVLTAKPITVEARAGSGGKLFGSVTASDIAQAAEAQTGAVVDRRKVHLTEPIKSLGTHMVPVGLHAEVPIEIVVEVVASS